LLLGLFVFLATAVWAGAYAQLPEVDRASVERVIRVLADDDMEGRGAFTPAAMRAAQFIAAEFESIGLEQVAGNDGYVQRFAVVQRSTESCSVTLDGVELPAERVACSVGDDAIAWSEADDVNVVRLGGENPMQAFQAARREGVDTLILTSGNGGDGFSRIAQFVARPSRGMTGGGGNSPSIVMALADGAVESFSVRGTSRGEELPLANVVGRIDGNRADEFVLFSAHYDHTGISSRPVDGDAINNGANDDASGTTAVIELARYFASQPKPERTLLFAAFTAEEAGGYGSRYFSAQLEPDQIVAMFNIEMIGKPAVSGPNTAWITGFDRSSFGRILAAAVEGTVYEFYADPYPDQNLFFRSDNATLARLGVPAHSISTTPIDVDPDYHQVSDEVDTLDLDHMTNTIRAIALGAATIISGEATPTRVDPDSVRR
jgi:hypothetical protein